MVVLIAFIAKSHLFGSSRSNLVVRVAIVVLAGTIELVFKPVSQLVLQVQSTRFQQLQLQEHSQLCQFIAAATKAPMPSGLIRMGSLSLSLQPYAYISRIETDKDQNDDQTPSVRTYEQMSCVAQHTNRLATQIVLYKLCLLYTSPSPRDQA